MAHAEIERAGRERRVACVTGGTGLYLRALTAGLAVIPDIPPAIRRAARAHLAAVGPVEFHAELAQRDSVMAARLRVSDRQRLMRAWEVLEATGQSLAAWQDAPDQVPPADWKIFSFRLLPPRETVYAACNDRFDRMIDRGAVEEARAFAALDLDPSLPAMKAVGVPPMLRFVAGDMTLEDARQSAQRDTRRYARRQMTWFRNQMTPTETLSEQYSERLNSKIFPIISDFLLTTDQ